jgi:hypothetical protein
MNKKHLIVFAIAVAAGYAYATGFAIKSATAEKAYNFGASLVS